DWSFAKSREFCRLHLERRPFALNYLAYDLIGRMHRRRAEEDAALTDAEREAELATALTYLEAALQQQPEFFLANLHFGIVHADRKEYALADQYFAKAVWENNNDFTARSRWARSLAEQERARDAIIQYVAAAEIDPESADTRDRLARLYLSLNLPQAAREQWEVASSIDPLNRDYVAALRTLPPANP